MLRAEQGTEKLCRLRVLQIDTCLPALLGLHYQPVHRRADRAQSPAAWRWPIRPDRSFPACGLTRSCPQRFQQLLPHAFAFLEVTSVGPRRVGGQQAPPLLPLHTPVTSHKGCPSPAAATILGAPRHAVPRLPLFLARRCTARTRKGGHHERDNTPILAARASLAVTFSGWPSRCSCSLRWVHITDFDRQNA